MRKAGFRCWLEQNKPALKTSSVNTYVRDAALIERRYGRDLDPLYAEDRLEGVLSTLRYTVADERASKPNPSKLRLTKRMHFRSTLSAYATAVRHYRDFRDSSV